MPRVWFLLPALLAAAPAPKPVHIRFNLRSSPDIASRAVTALERGLFSDSLIVQVPRDSLRLQPGMPMPADSVGRSRIPTVALVRGRITTQGADVDLCIVVLNALARPMSGPDSTRIPAGSSTAR